MRLLPLDAFAHVLAPLQGKRIGYAGSIGNVGDQLIDVAALQLFREFGIRWKLIDAATMNVDGCDELVYGGGGNMGRPNSRNAVFRERLLETGLPVTVLPQSFFDHEDRPYKRVYVRERASQRFCPHGILAPDLALAYECGGVSRPTRRLGVFLRRDPERAQAKTWFRPDPIRLCSTPEEYLALAAQHERIITDRLHFAVCGLIAGRDTTLLANSYHKNASMHETWLRDLGCTFAANVEEALQANGQVRRRWFFFPRWRQAS